LLKWGSEMATVAFIGLGMMGTPMAACLAKAGHQLWVKDANPAVEADFVQSHAAQAVGADPLPVDWVITMLPNSAIVEQVLEALVPQLRQGTTVIEMSSSEPMRTKELASRLKAHGVELLDAPVSGGQKRAISGTLSIMAGGDTARFEQALPILSAMGSPVLVGPVGAGHALKALNNYVSAAGLLATVEALHVGEKFGLDPAVMTDVINNATGRNNTTENKVKQFMLNGAYNSAFALGLMAKDIGIAVSLGEQLGEKMPMGHLCNDIWQEANTKAPKADHTEMYRLT
jgi:3-hydroxyisobutyrate dehydrogenase